MAASPSPAGPTGRHGRHARHAEGQPRFKAHPRRRRGVVVTAWVLGILIPLAIISGAGAWLASKVLTVRDELTAAQQGATQVPALVGSMDLAGARTLFSDAKEHTAAAVEAANDPLWNIAEHLPLLGVNLVAARELTEATDDLLIGLTPLVDATQGLDPASLLKDGAISVTPFVDLAPAVHTALVSVQDATTRIEAIETSGTLSQLSGGKALLQSALAKLVSPLELADQVVPIVPTILGANGSQHYVVMFQNNAEARSLGGTALFFAEVTLDSGRITLDRVIPAGGGNFLNDEKSVIPAPAGFEEFAPLVFGRFIANATSRPSFASAAEIVMGNWAREYGWQPNGVISVDAVMLSYLMRATGDVPLPDGTVIGPGNVTATLLNTVLQTYNSGNVERDNLAQDAVYGAALAAVFSKLSTGGFDPVQLLNATLQGLNERRLFYWSADPTIATALTAVGADGGIPDSDATTDRVGLYLNDNVGSKLSFYLTSALETSTAQCGSDGNLVHRLKLSLMNTLPADAAKGLSPSILGQYKPEKLAPGVERLMIYAYAPTNGRVLSASVDGTPITVDSYNDDGHPVQLLRFPIPPGATSVVTIDVETTGAEGRTLETIVTPGVTPTVHAEGTLDCSTVVGAQ
ncbi:DUF4012 domain-containing protein [Microbacterium sp. AZCO]|uniref:DUF4012 domain-containing protein n=1 Tax=Microbacterium sp. AZCO TaxID=3142976 RepID=UPI0031F3B40C